MRLELTRVGLLAEFANQYTTRGAFEYEDMYWRLEETCCHSDSKGKPSTNPGGRNSLMDNNNNNNNELYKVESIGHLTRIKLRNQ